MGIITNLTGYTYNSQGGVFDNGKDYQVFDRDNLALFDAHLIPAGGFSFDTLKLLLNRPSDTNINANPGTFNIWANFTVRVWRVACSGASSLDVNNIDGPMIYGGNLLPGMGVSSQTRVTNYGVISLLGEVSIPVMQIVSDVWPSEHTFTFPSTITVNPPVSGEVDNLGLATTSAYFILEIRSQTKGITYGFTTQNAHGKVARYVDNDTYLNPFDGDFYFELSGSGSSSSNSRTYYLPLVALDAINTGTLINDTTELSFRGQVEQVKITYSDYANLVIDSTETYIQTLDGSRYYMDSYINYGQPIFTEVSEGLEITFTQDSGYGIESSTTPYHGFTLLPGSVYCQIDELATNNLFIEAAYASPISSITLSSTPVSWSAGSGGGSGGGSVKKLLVSEKGSRIAISTNGSSFIDFLNEYSAYNDVAIAAFKNESTIFAVTDSRGLSKITDNGDTEVTIELPNSAYANYAVYKNNKLYVATTNGIAVTQDDGVNFDVYQQNSNITHLKVTSNGTIYFLSTVSGNAYLGVLDSTGITIVSPTILVVPESGRNLSCDNAESLVVIEGAGTNGADMVIVAGYARGSACLVNMNSGSGSFSTFETGLESVFSTECVYYDGYFLYVFGGAQDSSVTPAGFGIARSNTFQTGSFVGLNIPGENYSQPYHIATLNNGQEIYIPLKGAQPPDLSYGNYLMKAVERTDGGSGFTFTFESTGDVAGEYVASYTSSQSGGGGGGGSSSLVQNAIMVDGKFVGSVSVDPRNTVVRVSVNGVEQSLPTGSVVRNSVTGQKFIKIEGGDTAFTAIELTPKVDWSWTPNADEPWQTLQLL